MNFGRKIQIPQEKWEQAVMDLTGRRKRSPEIYADLGISQPSFKKFFTMYWENGCSCKGLDFIIEKKEDKDAGEGKSDGVLRELPKF